MTPKLEALQSAYDEADQAGETLEGLASNAPEGAEREALEEASDLARDLREKIGMLLAIEEALPGSARRRSLETLMIREREEATVF